MNYQTYVFDCDGVLLDSNGAKAAGLLLALEAYHRRKADEFLEFHRRAGSISRRGRLAHYLNHILHHPGDLESLLDYAHEYICDSVSGCRVMPGVRGFLSALSARKVVVSGAEVGEVTDLLSHHDLLKHFDAVWGGPPEKSKLLADLVAAGEIERPAVYFGDTLDDYESATAAGLDFTFVAGCSEWADGRKYLGRFGVPIIETFEELDPC